MIEGGFTLKSKSKALEVERPLIHGLTFGLKIAFKLEAWFLLVGVYENFELGNNRIFNRKIKCYHISATSFFFFIL